MCVQISCKFHKDLIKTKQAMLRTRSNMVFFATQGQVTPKWKIRSGQMIQSKMVALSSGQHFLHYKSMRKFFVAQGRITTKWMVQSGPKSNSSKTLCLSSLPQVWGRSDQKLSRYRSENIFPILSLWELIFRHQGQVTPKRIFQSGPNLNFAKILCLSWFPASLMKIRSKILQAL